MRYEEPLSAEQWVEYGVETCELTVHRQEVNLLCTEYSYLETGSPDDGWKEFWESYNDTPAVCFSSLNDMCIAFMSMCSC